MGAERKSDEILDAGTIWKYENKSAPGKPRKVKMLPDMSLRLRNQLQAYVEELDNAGLEANPDRLSEEVDKAKEFVQSIKSNLAAYHEDDVLRKVLNDVERTVEMS